MNSEGYSIQNYLQTKVKDESFDVDLISQFDLCIQLYERSFSFCVIDSYSNRCLLLESYDLPHYPDRSFSDQLNYIFEDHHFLTAGFWKTVKISISNKQYSLIPSALFKSSALFKYLEYHTAYDPKVHTIYQYKHDLPESVNVFAVDSEVINKVKSFYPENKVKVIHQTSTLIMGAMKDQQSMSLKTIYLTVHKNSFTLILKNENALEYCNTFSYFSANEFIYYLMFIASTLNINKRTTKLVLLGDIDKDSEEYSKIIQYFKFISFGEKPSYLKYGYVFDEVSDHQFFDLYSIYLC